MSKKKINLTVDEVVYRILKEMKEVTGTTPSFLINNLFLSLIDKNVHDDQPIHPIDISNIRGDIMSFIDELDYGDNYKK